MVSLPQKQFIAVIVGVCVLSAGIGSGLALLAQEGPQGARGKQGKQGARGPQGPAGESAAGEVEALEGEVAELRERVEATEELEERVGDLESELSGVGGPTSALCEEFGIFC
jgi:hypothetical protein